MHQECNEPNINTIPISNQNQHKSNSNEYKNKTDTHIFTYKFLFH